MAFKNLMISEHEYEIPDSWEWVKLPDIIGGDGVFSDGDWVESKDQDPNGEVRLIQLADIGDGIYRDRSDRYLTHEKASELSCTFLEPGDLLIARMPDPLGRATIFPGDSKNCVTVVDVCIVRTCNKIDHRWLMHMVNAPQFRLIVESLQSGTTRKRISRKNLAKINLPLAPLNEQRRIVDEIEAQFTRLDAGIAALKRLEANLKRYKASVLKAACEGDLVPQDPDDEPASELLARILRERREQWETDKLAEYEAKGKKPPKNWQDKYKEPVEPDTNDLPDLPEGWVWATPDQIAAYEDYSLAIGPFGSNLKVSDYMNEGVPLVFVRNIRSGDFENDDPKFVTAEKAEELIAHQVEGGDILITKMGDPPGDAVVYPIYLSTAVITADCIKLRLTELLNDTEYFVHATHSPVMQRQIMKITRGVAQLKMSLGRFKSISYPIPPIEEQTRITQEIERLFSIIDDIEQATKAGLKRAERLRQSILKEAFAGRLVPQDPSDEPASELLARIRAERGD